MAEEKRVEDLAIKKPEAPKPVIETIPHKILDVMNKLRQDKNQLFNQMLNISFQVVELQKQQITISDKIKNNNAAFRDSLKNAGRKLKLQKRKNYRWRFDGKDSFVGNLIPEKPKKEEKK